MRIPTVLDRSGLRWALRVVSPYPVIVLAHRGRRSGKLYHTPVEVMDTSTRGEVLVSPLMGERSDWYCNIVAGGLVGWTLHGTPQVPAWRRADPDEALMAFERYQQLHPRHARSIIRWLVRLNHIEDPSLHGVASAVPVLALAVADDGR